MKKLVIVFALFILPLASFAQNNFDAIEDLDDVSSVNISKEMIKLMSKIEVGDNDKEAKEYKEMINSIDNLKVFASKNSKTSAKMNSMVKNYLGKANLKELMRVKDKDANVKFYYKQGSTDDKVAELLMFVTGIQNVNLNGKVETVLLSLTGDIDLKQISKLTKEFNLPGGEHLKKAEKK